MGETFSGGEQLSICTVGMACLSQGVLRSSSEIGSPFVSSNYS